MDLSSRFQEGKLLKEFSTFGIGGPARYFIEIRSSEEAQEVIRYCKKAGLAYLIVGKGSNCLFDDRGFDGLVMVNKIGFANFADLEVTAGAGYSFSLLGVQTARKGLSGLEFASGIPASVGGAVYMNAGANNAETADSLVAVTYVTEEGEEVVIPKEELSFDYRFSSFQEKRGMIIAARFQLERQELARQKQLEILEYRMRTQPYGEKSAGCVFRNPLHQGCQMEEGERKTPLLSAGALIERCGLKQLKIGGAEVSLLHANFIVNKGDATAQDVKDLVRAIQEKVYEKEGIKLALEIRYIPYSAL